MRRKMAIPAPDAHRQAPALGARCRAGLFAQCLVPCSFRVVRAVAPRPSAETRRGGGVRLDFLVALSLRGLLVFALHLA